MTKVMIPYNNQSPVVGIHTMIFLGCYSTLSRTKLRPAGPGADARLFLLKKFFLQA